MLNIFVCEDDREQIELFEQIIKKTLMIEQLDMQLAMVTDNPFAILELIQNERFSGLYFLDIDLKTTMNGLELAKEIRKYDPRAFIVFITTHSEMSYLTFLYKVEAMDFIIKDAITDVELRIRHCILDANEKASARPTDLQRNFVLKTNDKMIHVEFDKILYFETSNHIHKIILHALDRQVEFYAKMKEIEAQLDTRFFRCHKSYLVNRENINEVDLRKRIIYMKNGETCLVSARMLKFL